MGRVIFISVYFDEMVVVNTFLLRIGLKKLNVSKTLKCFWRYKRNKKK